jgi:uncharacterized protein DUF4242
MSASTKLFVVDRRLPGITRDALAMLQAALVDASRRLTARDEPIRYLRTTYVSEQGRLLCLFEARTAEAVRVVNETAQVPYSSIAEALDLQPPTVH